MRRLAQRWLQVLTVPIAFGAAAAAHAAEFCVTNSAELQAALTATASNGQHDRIKIQAGHYNVPVGGFVYNATFQNSDGGDLILEGGFSEFFDNPCGQQLTMDPGKTVLDGGNANRVMSIYPRNDFANVIALRYLTFANGNVFEDPVHNFHPVGGGLALGDNPMSGEISIEHNLFMNNKAQHDGGLSMYYEATGSARLLVMNNTFVISQGGAATLSVAAGGGIQPGARVQVINNTVINNSGYGLVIKGDMPSYLVANNNLWGNTSSDLHLFVGEGVSLAGNNIGVRVGETPAFEAGNISEAPAYEPCDLFCFEYVPVLDSPLVDAGLMPRSGANWSLPEHDLLGKPRIDAVAGRVDIGAYENHDRFFADRFEQ